MSAPAMSSSSMRTRPTAATRWYSLRKKVLAPIFAHGVMLATVIVIMFPVRR